MPSNRRSGDTGRGLAGFGLGGSREPPGPRARLSPWRAIVLATVIVIGGIYAAPNLFPPDFALQVTVDNSPRTSTTACSRNSPKSWRRAACP